MNTPFEAHYDADEAARAERIFYVRSILELRLFWTIAPPFTFLLFVAIGLGLHLPDWFIGFFTTVLVLSVLGPIVFYVVRPLAARRQALACPTRRIALSPEMLQVSMGDRTHDIAWARIKHVWDAGDTLLLVFGKFAAFGLPKRSLPDGAEAFIRACVKQASP